MFEHEKIKEAVTLRMESAAEFNSYSVWLGVVQYLTGLLDAMAAYYGVGSTLYQEIKKERQTAQQSAEALR